jgi:hypothetical protein
MAKKRQRFEWDDANMVWRDGDGKEIDHPRYSLKPASLGNTFIRSYIKAATNKTDYLNDWRKTNMNFTLKQIESAVKDYEKAYRAATKANGKEDTESLPRLRKRPIQKDSTDTKKARQIASMLVQYGARKAEDPRIKGLVDATQTKKK